jgi:hypothetical protein
MEDKNVRHDPLLSILYTLVFACTATVFVCVKMNIKVVFVHSIFYVRVKDVLGW